MKALALSLIIACSYAGAIAQSNYFEGVILYSVKVDSRVPAFTDNDMHKILAEGDLLTVYFKNGSYRRSSAVQDEYYIGKDQKVYMKFRNLDTLYYMDYSDDSTSLSGVVRSDSTLTVSQHPCKVITINTPTASSRYYYSTDLHDDTTYDVTNKIGLFNVYTRETGGSIYLWAHRQYTIAETTDSCVRIEPKKIDDHLFDLPALPKKKFAISSLLIPAHFPGNATAWVRYVETNLDSRVALKYVKLPKGQDEASVTVYVQFKIAEDGSLSDIQVVNKSDVHPKLAAEAERVISSSPRWVPGTAYGQRISYPVKQPVVFKVTKS